MDVQTPLICAGVVAVTSAVVYLSSVFGIRERTYEEAIEEQRRKNSLEISLKNNKNEKTKKEKNQKKKEKPNKKEKSKERHNSEPKTLPNVSPASDSVRKAEHAVGFKTEPEVVLLREDSESVEVSVQPIASYDKPIKPILVNKQSEQNSVQNDLFKQSVNGSGQRNSFDHILPKDELELLKDHKKANDKEMSEVVEEQTVHQTSDTHQLMSSHFQSKESIPSNVETDSSQLRSVETELRAEPQRTESSENSSPMRRTKRSKLSQIDGKSHIFLIDLIDFI